MEREARKSGEPLPADAVPTATLAVPASGAFIRKLSFIKANSMCNLGFTACLYPASQAEVTLNASYKNFSEHLEACSSYLFFSESGNSSKASSPPFFVTIKSRKCELKAAQKCNALNPLERISSNFSYAEP